MIRRHNIKNKNNNISNNCNNNKTSDSNLDIMNYLIQKLKFRQKKLKELDSFEPFYSQRKEVHLF